MADHTPKVVVIVGPTASGKTDLAIQIAKRFRGEVIAADSRTVYRGMDIGTAKPPRDRVPLPVAQRATVRGRGEDWPYVVRGIPHHLIDIRNPNESYSVAEFQRDAERLIRDLSGRDVLPILVGGTGLYVQALVENFAIPEITGSEKLRESFAERPAEQLLALLQTFDPKTAGRIDPKNKRRIIRALEVCIFTGQPFSEQQQRRPASFDFLEIGIDVPRDELYRRIDARVEQWFVEGLIDEVARLVGRYGSDIEPLQGVIYREVVDAVRGLPGIGQHGTDAAVADVKRRIFGALHAYARRQGAWFKRDAKIRWVHTLAEAEALVAAFVGE